MSELNVSTVDASSIKRNIKPVETEQRWTVAQIVALFEMPFNDLMHQAQTVHRENFDPNAVQVSTLLSIKTGGCSEDCGYCPQAARYHTDVENEPLMALDEVLAAAREAKEAGASRFCMGAAWRSPKQKDLEPVLKMISEVKAMGLQTCATLGMLKEGQASQLKEAGLDYYNHNLDTAPEFYGDVITTRTYQDRLDTLDSVREADINVCCGGIIGMGETRNQRAGLLAQLANMGATQRAIEAEGLAADRAQFEEARDYPYKMVQYQQSLLSGLPLATQGTTTASANALQGAAGGADTVVNLLTKLGLIK